MKPALFQNPGMHRTLPLARSLNDRSTTCSELIQRMIPLLRVSLAPFAGFFVRPWKSVRTSPGQRLCTLMPRPLTSMAIDSARLFRKAFVAQYTALLGRGEKSCERCDGDDRAFPARDHPEVVIGRGLSEGEPAAVAGIAHQDVDPLELLDPPDQAREIPLV